MDLSKLSDADLAAVEAGDMTKVSDAGLQVLSGMPPPSPSVGGKMLDTANATATGFNRGLVNLLGLPADTAHNVVDLTKAALGTPWLLAGKEPPQALQLQDRANALGTSENLRRALTGTAVGKAAITPSNPEYEGGYAQAAGAGMAGAGTPTQALMGVISSVAGKATADATGNPAASITASLLAPALARGAVTRKLSPEQRTAADDTLAAAQKEGYVVQPSKVGAGWLNNRLESIAGTIAIRQDANTRNQDTTNRLMARSVGLKPNELTPDNLQAIRAQAYETGYAPVDRIPRIDSTPTYRQALRDLEVKMGRPISPVNELRNPGVSALTDDLNQQYLTGKEANQLIRQLREKGTAKINSSYGSADGDKTRELGSAMRKGSGLLENLIVEHLQAAGPSNVVPKLLDARREIAKTHTVESALNPANGDVNPGVLAAMYRNKKPLSGESELVGRFAAGFPMFNRPGAATPAPGISATEAAAVPMLGALTRTATGDHAGWLAGGLPLLRSPVRNLILSKYYQRLFAHRNGGHDMTLSPQEQAALAASLAGQGKLDGSP